MSSRCRDASSYVRSLDFESFRVEMEYESLLRRYAASEEASQMVQRDLDAL